MYIYMYIYIYRQCLLWVFSASRKITLVSDGWLATLSAIKQYRKDKHLNDRTLPHEVVCHSAGVIVNPRGHTTNAIEAKWSVLKRWVRKRGGGKLPAHSDREAWRRMLGEHCYRCGASRGHSLDGGHTYVVPLRHFMCTLAGYFKA